MEIDLVLVRVVEFDLCDRAKTVLLKFIAERGKLLVGRHHRGLTFFPRGVLQAGGCPVRDLDTVFFLELPLQVDTLEARVVVERLSINSDFVKRTRSPGRVTARARETHAFSDRIVDNFDVAHDRSSVLGGECVCERRLPREKMLRMTFLPR